MIFSGPDSLQANSLSELETRGQQIYRKGFTSDSQISAFIGSRNDEINARFLPCVNCHGLDGHGKPEGGLEPSNITWAELVKPYGHKHLDGREHPHFSEHAVITAVTKGIDPAGNKLNPAMPRYSMSEHDLKALIAYIKIIGTDLNPGLSQSTIKVGVLLPSTTGPLYSLIEAYFKDINDNGGIYGRTIELVTAEASQDTFTYTQNVRKLVEQDEVFALFGVAVSEADKDVFHTLRKGDVPFVTPLIVTNWSELKSERLRFSLLPGLIEQARVLVTFAARELNTPAKSAIVLPPDGGITNQIRDIIFKEAKAQGWPEPDSVRYSGHEDELADIVDEQTKRGTEVLFYFGSSGGLLPLMKKAEQQEWVPYLFTPGMISARPVFSLSPAFDGRVFMANPTLPSDFQKKSLIEFAQLQQQYRIPRQNELQMLSYYAAVKIFVEGIRRSGRDLSRDKLIHSLETLTEFETGLTPRITFNENRRIGSLGSYIIAIDLARKSFKRNPVWIDPK